MSPRFLLSNFCKVLRHTFSLKGRASRRELWGFVALPGMCYFLWLLTFMVLGYFVVVTANNPPQWYLHITALVNALYMLVLAVLALPFCTLCVRRLHDVGMSGKWMLAWIILNAAPMLFTLSALANGEPFMALAAFVVLPTIFGKLLCGLFGQPEAEAVVALALTLCWGIADFLLSFFLLIYFIGKGDTATNEYGPATQP